MSNIARYDNLKQIVTLVQPQFEELARIHNAVNYKMEASFALQIIQENSYLADMAIQNPDSFKRAIINVAAIGLSLNPVEKLAYLVPRDKKVCLDISYIGYLKLATDIGAIKWAAAEIVRENDEYTFQGVNREPIHKFHPFKERGAVIGGYCLAKTHDGEFILSQMTGEEILSIRDRSTSFAAGKNSPWKSDENEMIKKTLIKRGFKNWPRTDTRKRFDEAIDVTNEADPIVFAQIEAPKNDQRVEDLAKVREHLATLGRSEERFLGHLSTVNNREIKTIDDLTENEISKALIMLDQFVEQKIAKDKKNENVG